MSHEIRTPMNGIIGMATLLLGTGLDRDQRQYAEAIDRSADALLQIINDILDFSKIEAGKLDIEHVDFNLRSLVEDVADLLAVRAHEKGLELAMLMPPGTPMALRGDPGRIRQILVNLASNAVKFTEEGEVLLRVSPIEELPERVRMRFEVRDTGIGIPAAQQSSIFASFSQADASTTRRFGGTGLGLAIVRQLAELMGGEVGLDSVEGEGSVFWVELPLEAHHPRHAHAGNGRAGAR